MVGTTTTINQTSHKKMSIQVSLDGLSFCILNKDTMEIEYFKNEVFKKQLDPGKILTRIEAIFNEESRLQQTVQEATLLFNNSLYSLVPTNFYDQEHAVSYLKFNTKILKTDFVAHDEIGDDIVNVYIPYTNIINYCFDKFGEFEYRHSLSVLIESLLQLDSVENPVVYLHSHLKNYELVVITNGKLILANSFEFETKEDFIYYLLFTLEQLELSPLEVSLILLGDLSKDSDEYAMLYTYVKDISFLGPFHSYTFTKDISAQDTLANYLTIKSLT